MLFIQMTGLSASGKSSIASLTNDSLVQLGYKVELLDGDECRRELCADLGFSHRDRLKNIGRLGFVGLTLARHGIITIMAAINPYEEARASLKRKSPLTRTVFINCPLAITIQRDPKGLYKKALLPADHPEHLTHFTGISDPYEIPEHADLVINTDKESKEESARKLVSYILKETGKHS